MFGATSCAKNGILLPITLLENVSDVIFGTSFPLLFQPLRCVETFASGMSLAHSRHTSLCSSAQENLQGPGLKWDECVMSLMEFIL